MTEDNAEAGPGSDGRAPVSCYGPAAVAARHHLGVEPGERLAAVGPLTDALIAP